MPPYCSSSIPSNPNLFLFNKRPPSYSFQCSHIYFMELFCTSCDHFSTPSIYHSFWLGIPASVISNRRTLKTTQFLNFDWHSVNLLFSWIWYCFFMMKIRLHVGVIRLLSKKISFGKNTIWRQKCHSDLQLDYLKSFLLSIEA